MTNTAEGRLDNPLVRRDSYFRQGRLGVWPCDLDGAYLSFQLGAGMKDHDSARLDHDGFAGAGIPSKTRILTSHGEHTKLGHADPFALLQGGFK